MQEIEGRIYMRLREITGALIIIFLFLGLLSVELVQNGVALEDREELSISYSYNLTKRETRGTITASSYNIPVILRNSGTKISTNTTVTLTDEEMIDPSTHTPIPLYKENIFVEPGENVTILFSWNTTWNKNQNITISYFPTNQNVLRTDYNSGTQTFLLNIVGQKKSTPGFTIPLLFAAFLIIILIRRYRR